MPPCYVLYCANTVHAGCNMPVTLSSMYIHTYQAWTTSPLSKRLWRAGAVYKQYQSSLESLAQACGYFHV